MDEDERKVIESVDRDTWHNAFYAALSGTAGPDPAPAELIAHRAGEIADEAIKVRNQRWMKR